jgi:hypothetical protein
MDLTSQMGQKIRVVFVEATECHTVHTVRVLYIFTSVGSVWQYEIYAQQKSPVSQHVDLGTRWVLQQVVSLRTDRFTPEERRRHPMDRRLGGSWDYMGDMTKKKSDPVQNQIPILQLVV